MAETHGALDSSQQQWYIEELPPSDGEDTETEPPPAAPLELEEKDGRIDLSVVQQQILELPASCGAGRTWAHRTLSCSGDAPSARGDFSWVACGTKHVLFGGAAMTGEHFNDTWILTTDSATNRCTWTQPPLKGKAPPARSGHAAVAIDDTTMLVFGGMDPVRNAARSDVWALDTTAMAWRPIACEGAPALSSAAAVLIRSGGGSTTLVLIGGVAADGPCMRVWSADIMSLMQAGSNASASSSSGKSCCGGGSGGGGSADGGSGGGSDGGGGGSGGAAGAGAGSSTGCASGSSGESAELLRWVEKRCSGAAPPPREMHAAAAAAHGGQQVVMVGGRGAARTVLSDAWSLDTQAWRWRRLADCPAARCALSAWDLDAGDESAGGGRVAVFGGWDGGTCVANDLFILDVAAQSWSAAAWDGEEPSGRFAHRCCAAAASSDSILVFGGVCPEEAEGRPQVAMLSVKGI